MKVEPRMYVSIHYTLKLDNGEAVDSTEGGEPLGFIQGSGQIIEGLDRAVLGRATGEKFTISIPPGEAYGEKTEEMHRDIPRENFPSGVALEPGMAFTAAGPHGPVSFRIVHAGLESVTVDFGHPLAGETLHFEVEIAEAREPNAEELAGFASGCYDDCGCEGECGPGGPGGGTCGSGCGCS